MSDAVEQVIPAGAPAPAVQAQPAALSWATQPVSLTLFSGAVVNVIVAIVKARWGVDFSGQESNLTMIVMGATAFIAHRK